jgi:hypothetical protein
MKKSYVKQNYDENTEITTQPVVVITWFCGLRLFASKMAAVPTPLPPSEENLLLNEMRRKEICYLPAWMTIEVGFRDIAGVERRHWNAVRNASGIAAACVWIRLSSSFYRGKTSFSHFLTFSHIFSHFLTFSHIFSHFLTISHIFSHFLTFSHSQYRIT